MRPATSFLCLLPLAAACAGPAAAPDPSRGEVPLPAGPGWEARLLWAGDAGVWTVEAAPVFPQHGSPAVVGLDDRGRCLVLVSYSGKWTPLPRVHDGRWLGGFAFADLDPRAPGAELYVGGQAGNLYQLRAYPEGALDARRIAHLPGREIHTLAGLGERGLLVLTNPGEMWHLTPDAPDGEWNARRMSELPGRIRDAEWIRLPGESGRALATVSRAGLLELWRFTDVDWKRETVWQVPMGLGRVAWDPERPEVLYTAVDDGRIVRHERGPNGWRHRTIYDGPQGARGVAAGRFSAEPGVEETVAVFGYSGRVELLSRRGDEWSVETIFTDVDKGHWLAAAELDGRNETRELLASGYSGRVVMLVRPPGYGRPGAAR
ncbi:MAG: hypothetical protein D6702_01725 [Planctomycetota bacterium]|nr:MAG: hypothetical protein D6702_01725 [Planctomycetota bacterium]